MRIAVPAWLGALLLNGCATPQAVPYVKPALSMPAQWSEALPATDGKPMVADSAELRRWWTGFRDPVLDRLIDRALIGNLDLKIASQRLLAARAEREAISAARAPQIGVAGDANAQRSSTRLDYPPGIGVSDGVSLQIEASWEPDLFGRLRYAVEAADAKIGVAEEDRRAILVSLLAEITTDYVDLRSARERMAIAERDIARWKETLDATVRLHHAGLVGEASVDQARAEWQVALARLPVFRARIAHDAHALGILTGGYPGDVSAELEKAEPSLPVAPILPPSIPSQLLRNRPDIRAAERRVAAATARANTAAADLFPRFRIPLSLGIAASGIGALVSPGSIIWSVAATGSQTIYDKGEREARLRAMQALSEAQRFDYERSVHTAVRDVEDALADAREEAIRRTALTEALADSRTAVGRAIEERRAGTISTLDLLAMERSLYVIEDAVAESRAAQLGNLIRLYKALGGGWDSVYPDDTPIG